MKYSFVIIAFNEELNIVTCIKAIQNLQSLGNSYEIIVVDDGSHDNTKALVNGLMKADSHIRLISDGKNHGRGYGRFQGVTNSTGDYVIMVDADIYLQPEWLKITLSYMKDHDVAGGIAVPDGDVHYIWRRFKLQPKVAMGSTTITGNNGLYKRAVFAKVNFDKNLREGEDVDFNHRLAAAGYSEVCIPGLTVNHQEHKSFMHSMQWLYQSGIGATRQLLRFKEIRLPDIAFAITLLSFSFAIGMILIFNIYSWLLIPLLCLLGASFMHLRGKFYVTPRVVVSYAGAVFADALLITCYYVGRFTGFFIYLKRPAS